MCSVSKTFLEDHDHDCSESPYIDLKRKFSKQHVDDPVFISYSNYAQFRQCETSNISYSSIRVIIILL